MYSHQNLVNLAQALKERREDQGLSLRKISEWTKISVHTLQAIEEAKVNELPVYAYLRGFILSYAKALGMDEKEVEKDLKKIIIPASKEEQDLREPGLSASSPVENLIEKDMRLTPVILAISILFVIGSIVALTSFISSYKQEKKLDGKISSPPRPEIEPSSSADLSTSPLEEESRTEGLHPAELEERAEKKAEKKDESLEKSALAGPQDTEEPALEIIVKARGNVKLIYQVDKAPSQEVSLTEDQFEVLKAQREIFIKTDNSDLIYVFNNGKDLGQFGPGGKKEKYFYSASLKENKDLKKKDSNSE